MKIEIKVPSVGESITEATIASWNKKSGEKVHRDEVLLVLETDKASVEVVAEHDGVLTTTAKEGDVIKVGSVVGHLETTGTTTAATTSSTPSATPLATSTPPISFSATTASAQPSPIPSPPQPTLDASLTMSPAVRRAIHEFHVDPQTVKGTGRDGRLTKGDVLEVVHKMGVAAPAVPSVGGAAGASISPSSLASPSRGDNKSVRATSSSPMTQQERVPMTTIRKRIAERLVQAQHTAAILTTFNEIDMTSVSALRHKYKDKFKEKYNVSLGFMGFFVKAVIEALKAFPKVNAFIDGSDIVYNHHYHIGIAVGTEKGLLVPVLRHADTLSLAEIEIAIKNFATKARDGKISVDDLSGGTFTISNGGVYGSLMSTPILNPPQSGILGMHKIEDRPMAVNGQVVIRPMMYVALSYDHRMVDGGESVSFLVRIKDCMEDPARVLLEI